MIVVLLPILCFESNMVGPVLPFCSWTPQRQYGADYSRVLVIADASNEVDRTRFELTFIYGYGSRAPVADGSGTEMDKNTAFDLPM